MKIWDKISEKNQIMWTQQVSGEQLAQRFHHEQALGAELFGGSSRQQSWKGLPQAEKQRSIEAARLTGIEMATTWPRSRTIPVDTAPSPEKRKGMLQEIHN